MILRLCAAFRRNTDASTALEFALIAGPLLVLLLGTLEFGRAEWARQSLQDTATQGARCIGVLKPDCAANGVYDAAKTKEYLIKTALGWGIPLNTTDITLEQNISCQGISGFSRVKLVYNFQTAIPGAVSALVEKLPLRVEACFPNQPSS